jgi:hypothetical protein
MWTIRQEQMPALAQGSAQNFEDHMVAHLRGFAPALCKVRGEPVVRQAIRMGVKRALTYGFTDLGPIRLYLELMFPLGASFDTDFQLPWAGAILTDPERMTQTIRSQRLYSGVRTYLDRVAGPHAKSTIESLRQIQAARPEDLETPARNLEGDVIAGLRTVHPQKCDFVGEAILKTLFSRAVQEARRYEISSPLGPRLFAGLMFGFGHGITGPVLSMGSGDVDGPIGQGSQ